MSQIGYMMLAAGLGPIGAVFAIMHLLVHGFFKAGLFLGAGSVMHSMNDSVDIRKFGNLHKYMKITWITFLISWLAILGVPPFSAFWTKDKIITDAFTTNSIGGFIIGFIVLIAAGITSYYMSRLFFLIFYGKERWNKNEYKPHESDKTMTIPMIILAIFSICAGFLMSLFNFEGWMLSNINCGKYTTNCSKTGEMHTILPESLIMFLTLLFVVIGALLAWKLFAINKLKEQNNNKIITIVRDDLYQNQINNTLLVIPGRFISKALNLFDIRILNRLVNGIGSFFRGLSNLTLKSQTGNTRIYAVGIGIGIIILLIAVLLGGI
jgi:NADH-quinone oxidoreductase subunit L